MDRFCHLRKKLLNIRINCGIKLFYTGNPNKNAYQIFFIEVIMAQKSDKIKKNSC